MKNFRASVLLFIVSIVPGLSAVAQVSPDEGVRGSITSARCQYAASDACSSSELTPLNYDAEANKTFGQLSGPPGLPSRPTAYPGSYRPRSMGSGRRLAIGAAIGLGIGAAIGVKAGEHQPNGVTLKASAVFGVLGAAIGAGIASMPSPGSASSRHYRSRPQRRRRFDKEDEMASISAPLTLP